MISRSVWVISFTFIVAFLLVILPLPEWARPFRPQWVSLTLLYWCIALPHRVGISSSFTAGIVLDALTGTMLGQHALGLSIVAFLAIQSHARIRVFPLWQQAVGIWFFLMIEHLLNLLVMGIAANSPPSLNYWAMPFTGALMWPWVFVILRDVRRRFNVS